MMKRAILTVAVLSAGLTLAAPATGRRSGASVTRGAAAPAIQGDVPGRGVLKRGLRPA